MAAKKASKKTASRKKKTTRETTEKSANKTPRKRSSNRRRGDDTLRLRSMTDHERGMDPTLQDLVLRHAQDEPTDPTLTSAHGEDVDSSFELEVDVMARLDSENAPTPSGLKEYSRVGDIVTGTVRIEDIAAIRQAVKSLKAARRVRPELDRSVAACNASPASLGGIDGAAWDGRNVIVGVVDYGCDFVHRNFRNSDGSTRLLALWDQQGGPTEVSPQPYRYGREYRREQIDEALADDDPYRHLGYGPERQGSHGTHVLDIAAGNGTWTGRPGVAPGADLVFVELAAWDYGREDNFGNSRRLAEAVHYVFEIARKQNRPCVVNLSLGTHGGPHDGSNLSERYFDNLLSQPSPGRAIVIAAGNSYRVRGHASGAITPRFFSSFVVERSVARPDHQRSRDLVSQEHGTRNHSGRTGRHRTRPSQARSDEGHSRGPRDSCAERRAHHSSSKGPQQRRQSHRHSSFSLDAVRSLAGRAEGSRIREGRRCISCLDRTRRLETRHAVVLLPRRRRPALDPRLDFLRGEVHCRGGLRLSLAGSTRLALQCFGTDSRRRPQTGDLRARLRHRRGQFADSGCTAFIGNKHGRTARHRRHRARHAGGRTPPPHRRNSRRPDSRGGTAIRRMGSAGGSRRGRCGRLSARTRRHAPQDEPDDPTAGVDVDRPTHARSRGVCVIEPEFEMWMPQSMQGDV